VDNSDFLHWIATTDGCMEELLQEHVPDGKGRCKKCGKQRKWPCNWHGIALQALDWANSTKPHHLI
jgi:hypothetical protein